MPPERVSGARWAEKVNEVGRLFLRPSITRDTGGGWTTGYPLGEFFVMLEAAGRYVAETRFIIPQGMRTDLASIPLAVRMFFWPLLFMLGMTKLQTIGEGVAHDWLYQFAPRIFGRLMRRAEADRIFLLLLLHRAAHWRDYGCHPWTLPRIRLTLGAWLMWSAVRIGGGRAWDGWREGGDK